MAEYIEREAVLTRLLKVCMPDDLFGMGVQHGVDHAVKVVREATAADVVEVVRCKDCKHKRHLQGATDEANICGLGWGLSGLIAEEDFCSYGKRRADNG